MTPIALAPPRDGRASSCEVPRHSRELRAGPPGDRRAPRHGMEVVIQARRRSASELRERYEAASETGRHGRRPDYGESHIRQRRGQLTSEDPS
jgi:hypothetical protein